MAKKEQTAGIPAVNKPKNDVLARLYERFGRQRIEGWQQEYAPRKLTVIEVEGKLAVLRPIGVAEIGTYTMMTVNSELGFVKANEFLLSELWLDGDSEIRDNEEYLIAALLQVQNSLELKKSSFYAV